MNYCEKVMRGNPVTYNKEKLRVGNEKSRFS